jgi:hypothetical protein
MLKPDETTQAQKSPSPNQNIGGLRIGELENLPIRQASVISRHINPLTKIPAGVKPIYRVYEMRS